MKIFVETDFVSAGKKVKILLTSSNGYYILILTKDYEVIILVTDKSGKIFEDRRKEERRKENIKVNEERRKEERRKSNKG